MKPITQILSGALLFSCVQLSLAGPDCPAGTCAESTAVTVAATGEQGHCAAGACEADAVAAGHERVQYVVSGMTCGGCSSAVTKSLAAVEGVTVKAVCHKSGTATVDFDIAKVKKAEVAAAISTGTIAITAERVTVPVEGMTCGSCTGKVAKVLNAIEGVTVQTVCHKSGKAVVDVAEGKSTRAAVVKAITDTGYKAS